MNIGRIIITLHNPEAGRLMESNREFWWGSAYLQDMQCHCSFANSAKGCNIFRRVLTLEPFSLFVGKRAESKLKVINETRGPGGWNVL